MNDDSRKWKIYSKLYLLAAMAVAAFFLAVRLFEIERISGKVLFNAGIDVLGLFICIALYFGCIDENRTDIEESIYWLIALILQIGLSFFNNELSWFVVGEPEYRQLYLFLNELTKIYDFSLTALFYNYVRRMLKFEGKLAEWLDSYIYILIIPFSILVLANSFVPINFYVDEQGVFHTLPLYRLVDLYLLIVAPITTLLLIRCKAALKQKIVALSFIVTPILHYILTSGAHGYASQYGSTLFAVTQIYSVLFSDNSRKLASTKTELHLARSVQASIIPKDFFQERKEFDVYDELDGIRCPVFILGAGSDMVLGAQASLDTAEKLGCEYYIYENYGHGVYDEAKDYLSRIKEFLDGHRKKER